MMTRLSIQKSHIGRYRADILICLFLVIVILSVFWQVKDHSFVTYDDDEYVSQNVYVQNGLTLKGVVWAFGFNNVSYWHPLTWLSHMLDVELYGMDPGKHHLTSVLFHIVSSLLLFLIFNRMTGAVWRSAFVAMLFAVHPINVESVAWVAERKSVLSTLFWMLTMWSYIRYVEHPGTRRYLWMVLFFILGLMAKPMLVTLPFVLLLLDFWPLGRVALIKHKAIDSQKTKNGTSLRLPTYLPYRLLLEKLPLFLLSAISIGWSSISVQRLGMVLSGESRPILLRIGNALVSYIKYLAKILWPSDLTFLYPYPRALPALPIIACGLLLLCITAVLLIKLRKAPYLAVGWFWYLGTLVPVIGLVQAGFWPAMADRFAYIPAVGIFIMIAWGIFGLLSTRHYQKPLLIASAAVTLMLLMTATWIQVGFWRSSVTLFKHTLEVTENNYLVHNNLGNIYFRQGRIDQAVDHYSESIRINPSFSLAHNNLGAAMFRAGNFEKAIFHFRTATRLNPEEKDARNNLNKTLMLIHYKSGNAHLANGELDQALEQYQKAISIQPGFIPALKQLAKVYIRNENYEKAISVYSEVTALQPSQSDAYLNIACLLSKLNRVDESVAWLSKGIKRDAISLDLFDNKNRPRNIRDDLGCEEVIERLRNSGNTE